MLCSVMQCGDMYSNLSYCELCVHVCMSRRPCHTYVYTIIHMKTYMYYKESFRTIAKCARWDPAGCRAIRRPPRGVDDCASGVGSWTELQGSCARRAAGDRQGAARAPLGAAGHSRVRVEHEADAQEPPDTPAQCAGSTSQDALDRLWTVGSCDLQGRAQSEASLSGSCGLNASCETPDPLNDLQGRSPLGNFHTGALVH